MENGGDGDWPSSVERELARTVKRDTTDHRDGKLNLAVQGVELEGCAGFPPRVLERARGTITERWFGSPGVGCPRCSASSSTQDHWCRLPWPVSDACTAADRVPTHDDWSGRDITDRPAPQGEWRETSGTPPVPCDF